MYKYLLIDLDRGIVHKLETYDKAVLILAAQDHLLINISELTAYWGNGSEDLNRDWTEIPDPPLLETTRNYTYHRVLPPLG